MKYLFYLFVLFSTPGLSYSQPVKESNDNIIINPSLLNSTWNAQWITSPEAPPRGYGVYHFRKSFSITEKPAHFIIHVSADNRYKLYVNGEAVGKGPARSDLYNWNFETYDIASLLSTGNNSIAVLVWNMGVDGPVAQISNQTGFLLQGDQKAEEVLNTDTSWKVLHDRAYKPCSIEMGTTLNSYMAIGAGDEVIAKNYPWGWEHRNFDDSQWKMAVSLNTPVAPVGYGTDNRWTLTPRTIPQMEETMQRLSVVRRTAGIELSDAFLQGKKAVTIPAHTTASLLLDQSFETVAYPVLKVSKGNDASIRLTYSEALFDSAGKKGDRNDIKGKKMLGIYDIFYPDGGQERIFTTLWIRTYRYLQLDIQTGDEPLIIEDIYGMYTGYPFEQKATFAANDTSLTPIWETGWRTARLCAGETYFDCPYYEQLQYEGDTRIQALISIYNTGDDRLVRKSIHDFYLSRTPDGLTQGRYPSNRLQVIPPYSLFWVSMLYDYHMLSPDTTFLKQYLNAASAVLNWYEQHIDADKGMLGPMNWWNFTDWDRSFDNGVADGATDGNSSILTLQYAYTLEQASALYKWYGRNQEAAHYSKLAKSLAQRTYQLCFDPLKMEMANQPDKKVFSQHAGIMAILANAIPAGNQQRVMKNTLYDSSLSQATFYYRFYLTRAMIKAGMGNLYYSQLTPWWGMLKIGLTTFAEEPEPTRSDCHAWSASPNYDFLATICGITPSKAGFKEIQIEPHLGELEEVKASMPHPEGEIILSLKRAGINGIHAVVTLPGSLTGSFLWNGKKINLKPGEQKLEL
ncbi:MAG: alpha-L-rhamnosidase N-terminal domain-containing protein [Ginsengibacter sp.]